MKPLLTTITPYWGRREALEVWLEALRGAATPEVEHILFFCGEKELHVARRPERLRTYVVRRGEDFSIGHVHNEGAMLSDSQWIMKLDVDTIPNMQLFRRLVSKIKDAAPREWFNIGMVYLRRPLSNKLLAMDQMPLGEVAHRIVTTNLRVYSSHSYYLPAATNWVCRRDDYINLGGCVPQFAGYGWEDYQQIYMLERHLLGTDPLPGSITEDNVTRRCRDEISRRKAADIFRTSPLLCLLHRWHEAPQKVQARLIRNRQILLNYILACRA